MQALKRAEDLERSVHKDTYIFPYMTVIHEYDARGCHRLILHDRCLKVGGKITTDWYAYEDIITIGDAMVPEYRASQICATTQYYEGIFPRVFRTTAAERLP